VDIIGKKIMILGEGVSGRAAFEALREIAMPYFFDGEFLRSCTSCAIQHDNKKQQENVVARPDIIITSPGIGSHALFDYALQHGVPVISELELGFLLNRTPVVAITGTNGKTTVTKLIGDMLSKKFKVAVCGNIGLPFSSVANGCHDIAVVEVSSFQLERCYQFKPHIAVITNISEDHLDRHGNMQNYIDIKMSINKNQAENDYFILPAELKEQLPKTKSNLIFSDESAYINCGYIEYLGEKVVPLSAIKISGEHNKKNIMQAMIAAKLMGVSNEDIEAAVSEFEADRHRLELVGEKSGKKWYDDSKATNIEACLSACESMVGDTALILGGSDKGYEYGELFRRLPKGIKVVFLMGEVKEKLRAASRDVGHEVMAIGVLDLAEAVRFSRDLIVDNVLLSPAAASFDMYRDYKERGEDFRKLVDAL